MVMATVALTAQPATAQLLGPTPYLSSADSPFSGGSFVYFFLDDLEDNALNTLGVTGTGGSVIGPGGATDAVDADDGAINGSGTNARSFFGTNLTFTFSQAALGQLPTHVGVVWTDGVNPISFEAFDAGGVSMGTVVGSHADGSIGGTTAEDRFYGAINPGGISSMRFTSGGAVEADHIQYGFAVIASSAAPEPATLALVGMGLLPVLGAALRKPQSKK